MSILSKKIDRILAIPAMLILILAWFAGTELSRNSSKEEIESQLPSGSILTEHDDGIYSFKSDSSQFIVAGEGNGYGGILRTAVQFSSQGQIRQVYLVNHKETPSFVKRLKSRRFSEGFTGMNWEDILNNNDLPDGISGATFTCRALTEGVITATHLFASEFLDIEDLPEQSSFVLKWTVSHTILVLVLLMSVIITHPRFRRKITARWILLIFNLIFLGFWTGNQISIVQISRLTSGEFPPPGQHLFFYILIGGSFTIMLLLNKNLYYDRICPFGAAQDCLAAIGGSKRQLRDKRNLIRWIPRILSLSLLTLGLIFRHPSSINYEVFSAFFQVLGNSLQFGLLILVLLSSLFIKRPWCTLFCPVKPVFEYVGMLRNWIVTKKEGQ